jgi:predicted amino acid-binding ACT domain protein
VVNETLSVNSFKIIFQYFGVTMQSYVISVMSADHPGIVAAVSEALNQLGANIQACSQTVLNGYFTLITIFEIPEPMEPSKINEILRQSKDIDEDYQLVVRTATPSLATQKEHTDPFIITAFGKDRPGIIRDFTQYLSGRDINIADLFGEQSDGEFHLVGQLEIPVDVDVRLLQDDLEEIGRERNFTVRLQHKDIFTATNQLRFG